MTIAGTSLPIGASRGVAWAEGPSPSLARSAAADQARRRPAGRRLGSGRSESALGPGNRALDKRAGHPRPAGNGEEERVAELLATTPTPPAGMRDPRARQSNCRVLVTVRREVGDEADERLPGLARGGNAFHLLLDLFYRRGRDGSAGQGRVGGRNDLELGCGLRRRLGGQPVEVRRGRREELAAISLQRGQVVLVRRRDLRQVVTDIAEVLAEMAGQLGRRQPGHGRPAAAAGGSPRSGTDGGPGALQWRYGAVTADAGEKSRTQALNESRPRTAVRGDNPFKEVYSKLPVRCSSRSVTCGDAPRAAQPQRVLNNPQGQCLSALSCAAAQSSSGPSGTILDGLRC